MMDDEFIVRRVRMRRGTAVAGNSTLSLLSLLLLLLLSARVRLFASLRFAFVSVSVCVFISYILFSSHTDGRTDGRSWMGIELRAPPSTPMPMPMQLLNSHRRHNPIIMPLPLPYHSISYPILSFCCCCCCCWHETPRHVVL